MPFITDGSPSPCVPFMPIDLSDGVLNSEISTKHIRIGGSEKK